MKPSSGVNDIGTLCAVTCRKERELDSQELGLNDVKKTKEDITMKLKR